MDTENTTALTGLRRSMLFVPGNRPERFSKALATAADLVCVDLEDAVSAGAAKEEARAHALHELSKLSADPSHRRRLILRINSVKTADGLRDVLALRDLPDWRPPLVVPKTDSASELAMLDQLFVRRDSSPHQFLPMIETLRGLEAAAEIARSLPAEQVIAVMIGCVDLSIELNCTMDWDSLLYARSRVVHAARLAGVAVLDTPNMDARNLTVLADEAARAARLGFSGKAAIHPAQIEPIHRAFAPTAEQIKRAQEVIQLYEQMAATGAALLDGKLVDLPVYLAAKNLLAAAQTHRAAE
jgi:(S)-citramalyl-CoA lyase